MELGPDLIELLSFFLVSLQLRFHVVYPTIRDWTIWKSRLYILLCFWDPTLLSGVRGVHNTPSFRLVLVSRFRLI